MIDITELKVDISGYRKFVQFLRSPNDDINAPYLHQIDVGKA